MRLSNKFNATSLTSTLLGYIDIGLTFETFFDFDCINLIKFTNVSRNLS